VFVAYAEANDLNGLTGAEIAGFRLFDGAVTHEGAADGNTGAQKEFHERVIANRAVADALFTIVPNADATGYILSAQGQYMQTTAVHAQWSIQAFDADEAKAGVYLFETAESADIYKLRSNKEDGLQYVNDWGPVFGNNSASDTYARFSLTQITEYTLNVPANGVTTLCLPFNVQLPEGVKAYDIVTFTEESGRYKYNLAAVAVAGDVLAKNTPVIIEAEEGNYTLTITMDDEGAKVANTGSVLRSGLVKTTVAAGNNYTAGYGNTWGNDQNQTMYPDNAVISQPGVYNNVLSVASMENSYIMRRYIAAGDRKLAFVETSGSYGVPSIDIMEEAYGLVLVPGYGDVADFEGLDLTGKIALVQRGSIAFMDKCQNAQNAGAVACIVYNNDAGEFGMDLTGSTATIPCISVMMEDG
jgi:hypothetical protein